MFTRKERFVTKEGREFYTKEAAEYNEKLAAFINVLEKMVEDLKRVEKGLINCHGDIEKSYSRIYDKIEEVEKILKGIK